MESKEVIKLIDSLDGNVFEFFSFLNRNYAEDLQGVNLLEIRDEFIKIFKNAKNKSINIDVELLMYMEKYSENLLNIYSVKRRYFLELYKDIFRYIDLLSHFIRENFYIELKKDYYLIFREAMKERLENEEKNIRFLVNIGIFMEAISEKIYISFLSKFKKDSEIKELFSKLRIEEIEHRKVLEEIYEKTNNLDDKVNIDFIKIKDSLVGCLDALYIECLKIERPHEAIDIANALEGSEINILFEFIVNKFLEDSDKKKIILMELQHHAEKLKKYK